jgi:hypothetical protein
MRIMGYELVTLDDCTFIRIVGENQVREQSHRQ